MGCDLLRLPFLFVRPPNPKLVVARRNQTLFTRHKTHKTAAKGATVDSSRNSAEVWVTWPHGAKNSRRHSRVALGHTKRHVPVDGLFCFNVAGMVAAT